MTLLEWFWSKLPDSCQVHGCCRQGMRGNENRIYLTDYSYIIACDYCSSAHMHHQRDDKEEDQYYVG